MHRSILTGLFVFTLATAASGIAAADEMSAATAQTPIIGTSNPGTGAAAPVTSAPAVAPDPAAAASASAPAAAAASTDSGDAAAPTAGADLAMWNASASVAPQNPIQAAKPLTRLRRFASGIVNRSSAIASSLTRSAMRFIGVPYVFGGTRTTGFDCSGYVQHVFSMNGLHLPRTADAQFDAARHIRAKMIPGDLVFFHTYAPGVSHVGIYLGNSKFIHASSSRGVAVSSLHDRYWAPRYLGAKRVVGS